MMQCTDVQTWGVERGMRNSSWAGGGRLRLDSRGARRTAPSRDLPGPGQAGCLWPSQGSSEKVAQGVWPAQGPKSSSQRGRFPPRGTTPAGATVAAKPLDTPHLMPNEWGHCPPTEGLVSSLHSPPFPRLLVEGAHSGVSPGKVPLQSGLI